MSCGSSLPPPAAAAVVVRSKLGVQRDFPFRGCLKLSGSESRLARRGRAARALVSWLVGRLLAGGLLTSSPRLRVRPRVRY